MTPTGNLSLVRATCDTADVWNFLCCLKYELWVLCSGEEESDEEMPDESRASSSRGVVNETASTSGATGDFMGEYSDALQHELQQSSLAKSFTTADVNDESSKVILYSKSITV